MATTRNRSIAVMLTAVVGLFTSGRAWAGTTNEPASPTNPASAMWTLNDLYNVLNTRTTNVALRSGGFAEPTGGPTNNTMRTLDEIMSLVNSRAAVPKTGQTTWYRSATEDGGTQLGVAWPNPRFTVVGAPGTAETNQIKDNLTGLIWARDANLASNTAWSVNGTCTWFQAFDVITNSAGPVNGANYGGTNDWRLPNLREMQSLICYGRLKPALCNTAGTGPWTPGDPFVNVVTHYPAAPDDWWLNDPYSYWTSTAFADSSTLAWYVRMRDGGRYGHRALYAWPYYVWPVRGGR